MPACPIWLPSVFSDNMVLQAGKPVVIWGQALPGQTVRAEVAGRTARAVADRRGAFVLTLPVLKPGGPHPLRIASGRAERTIENVLIGEVWLGSGQSNMSWPVGRSTNAREEIAQATYPAIRLFTVSVSAATGPLDDVEGRWVECSPQTVADFSAVAYFFGRDLHQSLKTPVGLIDSSWGGTKIEPWISLRALKTYAGFAKLRKAFARYLGRAALAGRVEAGFRKDPGNKGVALGWAAEACGPGGWREATLPGYWTQQGTPEVGAFWFRRTVQVPPSWAGKDLWLSLGPIVDLDTTYFNGQKVGGIGLETQAFWEVPRQYLIPAGLVHAGTNTIAVRAFAHNNGGGFEGPADAMHLRVINGPSRARVSLAGAWHFRAEAPLPPRGDLGRAVVPTTVFNAMIAPLTRFVLRGFLWYQGESNVDEPAEYRELFALMIRDWRRHWGDARLPLYFVQLPDYGSVLGGENLALLREVQAQSLRVPHTGMAVAIDGGEGDVHPRKKQPIGRRLALQALAKTYGRRVECEGPTFRSMAVEGGKIRIRFDHARGLTTADGGPPADFAVAGADCRFVLARARIEGDAVVVWSPKVPNPAAVRYAWGATPKANVINAEGLPAGPFRTDDMECGGTVP